MLKKIIIRNVIFTVILLGIVELIKQTAWNVHLHSSIPWILLFYFVLSLLISWMMELAVVDRDKFVILAMGAIVLRLLITILSMVVVVLAGIENQELFIINFFALYLCYLVFELTTVLSNLRPKSI